MGNEKRKGQSSLEALVSFAALLCALSILLLASRHITETFSKSISDSRERIALSSAALLLDSSADAPREARALATISSAVISNSSALVSSRSPQVREPLFHTASISSQGVFYVQTDRAEPV